MRVSSVLKLAAQYYNFKGEATKLPGEEDENYRLEGDDGTLHVLKISAPGTPIPRVELEIEISSHLLSSAFPLNIPVNVPTEDGRLFIVLEDRSILRVQKWVPGSMLSSVNPRSEALLYQWGKTGGLLSKYLQNFDHKSAHRSFHWNPSDSLDSRKYEKYITDQQQRKIANYCWQLFEQDALPYLETLRKSVNYNDAHEHNLLVNADSLEPQITGLIDFGDAVYTETINELAIICAYAGMGMPDPVLAMKEVVRGYHHEFPLQEAERKVLFPLILGRLMITVTQAAKNMHEHPENEYLQISVQAAWNLLEKLCKTSPDYAYYTFRSACGLTPCTKEDTFRQWINESKPHFAAVMHLENRKVAQLDLSVDSLDLGNNSRFEQIQDFNETIVSMMADQGADAGIGGYLEVRPFYVSDAYQVEGNSGAQWRTVHLGIDIWDVAGAPVYAVFDGQIHSFQDNKGECNYGPTIILEHEYKPGQYFYTLYGHLSRPSLEGLEQGMLIKKGQQIATLGKNYENGNWPPHLHFQLLLDTLGQQGDFPGVAYPHEIDVWKSICPDTSLLFEESLPAKKAMQADDILASRHRYLGKNLSISYHKPLHIVRGYKQFLYDHTARRYLDTVNNVAHVGHEHPRVVRAGQRQMGLLNTNTRYLHENIIKFSEALINTFPDPLSVVYLVNSGSEANELALRMAENYTQSKEMLALEVGYHGNTGACVGVSSYKFDGKGGNGAPPNTHIASLPDIYRGKYQNRDTAGANYAKEVTQIIRELEQEGKSPAGFIGESIMSCGGQIVLPEGYLEQVYEAVRSAGGLCIADEVQTGLGRVGSHYWAFELHGVVPDIVTIGKPIGNGHPLGAVITTYEVAASFSNGMEFFNTFGGNPVSSAIGYEVLRVVEEEHLMKNALEVGEYLINAFSALKREFPIIGDVRGHGLFLGVELVKDHTKKIPATEEAAYLANRMRARGILMSTDGPDGNVLKIKPPMCFSVENADFMISNLLKVLEEGFLKQLL